MTELDIVRDLAKGVLVTSVASDELKGYVWDRAERLVRNVNHICCLPELSKTAAQIDHFCMISATYFSETGLLSNVQMPVSAGRILFFTPNGDGMLDSCLETVEEKLGSVAGRVRVGKINKIITESWGHCPEMKEAMILSDARNLEDMGAIGIFREFRRFISEDKSISEVLKNWRKKIDYRYWQSRLKNSFRFEEVRKLAEMRLSAAERFMQQLQNENEARDLKELIGQQPETN